MAKTYPGGLAVRIINVPFSVMARLGIGRPDRHVLTVPGSRSGKLRSTPVNVMEESGQRWLVAPYGVVGWVRNVRAAGTATLRRGGRSEAVTVTELAPSDAAPVLRKYLREVADVRAYLEVTADSSDEELAVAAQDHPAFLVQPAAR